MKEDDSDHVDGTFSSGEEDAFFDVSEDFANLDISDAAAPDSIKPGDVKIRKETAV